MTWKGLQAVLSAPLPFLPSANPQDPLEGLSMSSLESFHAINITAAILEAFF